MTLHHNVAPSAGPAVIIACARPCVAQPLTGAPVTAPKYSPDAPAKITTPDTVQTHLSGLSNAEKQARLSAFVGLVVHVAYE